MLKWLLLYCKVDNRVFKCRDFPAGSWMAGQMAGLLFGSPWASNSLVIKVLQLLPSPTYMCLHWFISVSKAHWLDLTLRNNDGKSVWEQQVAVARSSPYHQNQGLLLPLLWYIQQFTVNGIQASLGTKKKKKPNQIFQQQGISTGF